MHLADDFIQRDLQCIQAITLFIICQYMCSLGIEPTTFSAANTMLYHWAIGTFFFNPQVCKTAESLLRLFMKRDQFKCNFP